MKRGSPGGRPYRESLPATRPNTTAFPLRVGLLRVWFGLGMVGSVGNLQAFDVAFAGVPPAEVLMRAGRLGDAWPVALADAQGNPADLDAQERLIDLAHTMQLTSVIISGYRARVTRDPNDADGWYLLGRIAMSVGEAEGCYRKALAIRPDHPRAPMGLGAVRRAQGKPGEAVLLYRQALARDRALSEAWGGLQAALLAQGDVVGATQVAREAVVALPGEPDPWMALATLDRENATTTLGRAVASVTTDPRLYAMYARALILAGDGAGAEAQAKRALALAPDYAEAGWLRLVGASVRAGTLDVRGFLSLEEAKSSTDALLVRERFDALVAGWPRSPLPWLGRAKVRADQGNPTGALQDLDRAAALAPGEIEVVAARGLVLLQLHRYTEARAALQTAALARPGDLSLAVARAEAAQGAGAFEDARRLIVAALQRHPYDSRPVLAGARIFHAQGDREATFLLLRDAVQRMPDPTLVVALAAAARDAGRHEEAARVLDGLADATGSEKARAVAAQIRAEGAGVTGARSP